MPFFHDPVPHAEAAQVVREKSAVLKREFDQLPPELKALSFTIKGVEDLNVLQRCREAIATLPEGGDYEKIKGDLVSELSPFLSAEGAEARAELLLRMHGFQAYAVANYRAMEAVKDLFPFRKYLSAGDQRVRHSHAILNGLVFPADSPFWDNHTPPWEFGCRCDVVELDEEDVDAIRAREAKKAGDEKTVMEGPRLQTAELDGRVVRGLNNIADIRTPRERESNGFEFRPDNFRLPLSKLKEQYDPDIWALFEGRMRQEVIGQKDGQDVSVQDWLEGMAPEVSQSRSGVAGFVDKKSKVALSAITDDALDAMGAKHSVPAIMTDVFVEHGGISDLQVSGQYQPQFAKPHIQIATHAAYPRITYVHETAHHLDHAFFDADSPKTPASAAHFNDPHSPWHEFFEAARSAPEWNTHPLLDRDVPGYHNRPQEIFARAYEQWIWEALPESHPMKRDVIPSETFGYWSPESFASLSKGLDLLFTKYGLL